MTTSWKLVTLVVLAMALLGCGAAMAVPSGSYMVGDRVWLDNGGGIASLANNGIQDANEPGINGVSVVLSGGTSTGDIYAYTTKNTLFGANILQTGYYKFTGLNDADTYRITISGVQSGTISGLPGTPFPGPAAPVPADLVLTSTIVGSSVATIVGQGSDATGYWVDFKITDSYLEFDFGFNAPPKAGYSLGDTVWLDDGNGNPAFAANGIQDNGEKGLASISVKLLDSLGATIDEISTDANGVYFFSGLQAGKYQTMAAAPAGYRCTYDLDGGIANPNSNSGPVDLPSIGALVPANPNKPNDWRLDFGYIPVPSTGGFCTYTQGGWGAKPAGNNPGMLLLNNWTTVYPSGLIIGTPNSLTFGHSVPVGTAKFNAAYQVTAFLPQGGTAAALKTPYDFNSTTPPKKTDAGVLAGQVVALQLSVDFSDRGITKVGLGGLKIASGPFANITVNEFLGIAKTALGGGGLPTGITFAQINDTATKINENFDNGTTNNHFLN